MPKPTEINFHQASHVLEIAFEDGSKFNLPTEYLRVYSPSAEVQGHGPGQEVLQLGNETGIYSWETLYDLGTNYEANWQRYLERLKEAGHQRPEPQHLQ